MRVRGKRHCFRMQARMRRRSHLSVNRNVEPASFAALAGRQLRDMRLAEECFAVAIRYKNCSKFLRLCVLA
jgi:hypothetical protein